MLSVDRLVKGKIVTVAADIEVLPEGLLVDTGDDRWLVDWPALRAIMPALVAECAPHLFA